MCDKVVFERECVTKRGEEEEEAEGGGGGNGG